MAGTLSALLVLFAICLAGVVVGVRGEITLCIKMELCRKEFNDKAATIGHDRDDFCQLQYDLLRCYNRERPTCPAEQMQSAQRQIQSAQAEQRKACGATWIQASQWLMAVSAMLAVVFHRHF